MSETVWKRLWVEHKWVDKWWGYSSANRWNNWSRAQKLSIYICGAKKNPSTLALWARMTKNTDWNTGPLAHLFARLLALLTCSLALHCLLCSRAPLRSLVRSLTPFAHFRVCGTVNDWMATYSVFFLLFWTIVRWRQPIPCTQIFIQNLVLSHFGQQTFANPGPNP